MMTRLDRAGLGAWALIGALGGVIGMGVTALALGAAQFLLEKLP